MTAGMELSSQEGLALRRAAMYVCSVEVCALEHAHTGRSGVATASEVCMWGLWHLNNGHLNTKCIALGSSASPVTDSGMDFVAVTGLDRAWSLEPVKSVM
jgi:hypothetical protein